MPSSTSSSEQPGSENPGSEHQGSEPRRADARPGLRLTASDRPGVAQPVPERDVPAQPWRGIFLAALALSALLIGGWERHWRAYGVTPSIRNSDGLWSVQRRRIDAGEGDRTVLVGASRMLFDTDLDTWQRLSGSRPIQLALEGTTPVPVMENLADDPKFTGRLVVGVAPDVFFSGFAVRGKILKYFRTETPAQRAGQWLSMTLVEPLFAFYDPDFALSTVLRRQPWPLRGGMQPHTRVRKLLVMDRDRNTRIWRKVESDPQYAAMAQRIWAEDFAPLDAADHADLDKTIQDQVGRAAAATAKLRARGVEVIFVRPPSADEYLKYENRDFPRAKTWDVLIAGTGARGIHFQDYPELQDFTLPEWSHIAAVQRPRFTEALYRIVARGARAAPAAAPSGSDRTTAD